MPAFESRGVMRSRKLRRAWRAMLRTSLVVALSGACGGRSLPVAEVTATTVQDRVTASTTNGLTPAPVAEDRAADPDVDSPDATIDPRGPWSAIDPRLLGVNVPAWLGPDVLASDWLRSSIAELGVTTIRMPGGSWSNIYGWSACERRERDGCVWDGAARPADFADLLAATGTEGIWTVSINESAQSAAATVAYFNGEADDRTEIGVDRRGTDWGTVADWAQLRASGGHQEPVRIALWEVGNEVFGGKPDTGGSQCAPYGWEPVWTCDGTEYVRGNDEHDGFLSIRRAMLAVDPTIEVGAVGVDDPSSWGDWGYEVIRAAGSALDFYVVHGYGFDRSPSPREALERAGEMWPPLVSAARSSLPDVPLAITEYNLVSVIDNDDDRTMTQAMNALFVADTLGRFAVDGVEIASHWNLANGVADNGTDYGLVSVDGDHRYPPAEGFAVWGRAGATLLDVDRGRELPARIRVYPTVRDDGSIDVILLNLGKTASEISILVEGVSSPASVTAFAATDPTSTSLERSAAMLDQPPPGEPFLVALPAWSIVEMVVDVDS